MPKFGYALSFLNLLALHEGLSYQVDTKHASAGQICNAMVEDMFSPNATGLSVALVPLPRFPDSAEYESHPCDRHFHLKRIPFYESGLVMVTRKEAQLKLKTSTAAFMDALKKPSSFNAICMLLLGIMLSGHIMWFLEKDRNPADFPKEYLQGLDDACWWAAETVATIGYGDKVPRTGPGRMFAFFWMVVGLFITVFFTGTITTEMTRYQERDVLNGLQDVEPSDKVGAPAALLPVVQAIIPWAIVCGASVIECERQLKDSKVNVMIADYPSVVQFLATNQRAGGKYQLVGDIFKEGSVYDYNLVVSAKSQQGVELYTRLLAAVTSIEGTAPHRRLDAAFFGDLRFTSQNPNAATADMSGGGHAGGSPEEWAFASDDGEDYSWPLVAVTITAVAAFALANFISWLRKGFGAGELELVSWLNMTLRRYDTAKGRRWFFFKKDVARPLPSKPSNNKPGLDPRGPPDHPYYDTLGRPVPHWAAHPGILASSMSYAAASRASMLANATRSPKQQDSMGDEAASATLYKTGLVTSQDAPPDLSAFGIISDPAGSNQQTAIGLPYADANQSRQLHASPRGQVKLGTGRAGPGKLSEVDHAWW
eukprot:jgi/Mesvir1/17231/Mv07645-RA.1